MHRRSEILSYGTTRPRVKYFCFTSLAIHHDAWFPEWLMFFVPERIMDQKWFEFVFKSYITQCLSIDTWFGTATGYIYIATYIHAKLTIATYNNSYNTLAIDYTLSSIYNYGPEWHWLAKANLSSVYAGLAFRCLYIVFTDLIHLKGLTDQNLAITHWWW